MKKIDPGQTISIIANLGVIAGILLLVYELNQNRQMMQAQTRNDLADSVVNLMLYDAMDIDRAGIFRRGLAGEELSEDEQWVLNRRANAWFRYWENVHYQYRAGMYDQTEFEVQIRAIGRVLAAQPAAVEYWCNWRETYSPEFATEIDSLVETQCL